MLRGLYTSATGMEAQKQMHEIMADNVANINTTGYKSYSQIHKTYTQSDIYNAGSSESIGSMSYGAEAYDTTFNFQQGALTQTANPLDIAINGKGFFAIQDRNGGVVYTRDGNFSINNDGFLTTQQGELVLDGGLAPIFIGIEGVRDFTVLRNGNVQVNGAYNANLKVFDFPQGTAIVRVGQNKFAPHDSNSPMKRVPKSTVQQGFLEQSNVSPVKGAAEMVQIMRSYELNQRALRIQAESMDYLMNITDRI